MKRTFALALATALSASTAMAADLGGQGGYSVETVAPGGSASWSGFYIMGGVGRSSTAHDVKGQDDGSTAKALSDVFIHEDGKGKVTYNSTPCAEGEICQQMFKKGDTLPVGEGGIPFIASHPDLVGYTVDATNLFSTDGTASGFVGSLGLGYDKQFGSMLVGVMGDYQFRSNKVTIGGIDVKESDAIFLGARLGYLPTHNMLVYVLGGYTWMNHSGVAGALQNADPLYGTKGYSATYGDGSFGGFTLGGGAETPIAKNLYLGIEGRHTWYGKENVLASTYTYENFGGYHQDTRHITDEPTEWYVGATLKLKVGADGLASFK